MNLRKGRVYLVDVKVSPHHDGQLEALIAVAATGQSAWSFNSSHLTFRPRTRAPHKSALTYAKDWVDFTLLEHLMTPKQFEPSDMNFNSQSKFRSTTEHHVTLANLVDILQIFQNQHSQMKTTPWSTRQGHLLPNAWSWHGLPSSWKQVPNHCEPRTLTVNSRSNFCIISFLLPTGHYCAGSFFFNHGQLRWYISPPYFILCPLNHWRNIHIWNYLATSMADDKELELETGLFKYPYGRTPFHPATVNPSTAISKYSNFGKT